MVQPPDSGVARCYPAFPQWEPRKPLAANGKLASHLEPGAKAQTGALGMKKGPSAKPGHMCL